MPIIGFNHYNLRAPRELLDTLKNFYCDVIGLKLGFRPPFKRFGYWLYAGDQAILHLIETEPNETRAVDVATTFDHAAFTCSNFSETQAHLEKLKIKYELDHVPLTGRRQLFLRDPAGNGVELNFSNRDI